MRKKGIPKKKKNVQKNKKTIESIKNAMNDYLVEHTSICKAVANNCKRTKIKKSDRDLIEIILKHNGKL